MKLISTVQRQCDGISVYAHHEHLSLSKHRAYAGELDHGETVHEVIQRGGGQLVFNG